MAMKLIITILSAIFLIETVPAALGEEEIRHSTLGTAPITVTKEKALYNLADELTEMLESIRYVIAVNQVLINSCSKGHYDFKGLTPDLVVTNICNDFYPRTGIIIKQTSRMVRNPRNAPDEWEEKSLEMFDALNYPKGMAHTEFTTLHGKEVYRFIKPIYITKTCLRCHGPRKEISEDLREYLDAHYPNDMSTGYKEGELRGGISITIPVAGQF